MLLPRTRTIITSRGHSPSTHMVILRCSKLTHFSPFLHKTLNFLHQWSRSGTQVEPKCWNSIVFANLHPFTFFLTQYTELSLRIPPFRSHPLCFRWGSVSSPGSEIGPRSNRISTLNIKSSGRNEWFRDNHVCQ